MAVKFEPSFKGIGEVLKSPGVQADLLRRAEQMVAGAPTENGDGEELTYEARSGVGRTRARAAVIAAGARTAAHELANHELISLLDLAR